MINALLNRNRVSVPSTDPALPIEHDSLDALGSAAGVSWFKFGDAELRIDSRLHRAQLDDAPRADQRIVHYVRQVEQHAELGDGDRPVFVKAHREDEYFRASIVPAGSFERLRKADARRAAAKRPTEKPMRAWDTLAALPAMQRREAIPWMPGPVGDIGVGALKARLGKDVPIVRLGGHQPPDHSPAGIVAWLADRGVELSLARGRLVVRSRTAPSLEHKQLIIAAEELLVGHLAGKTVPCSTCSEPATSIVFPRAPMCAAHAQ